MVSASGFSMKKDKVEQVDKEGGSANLEKMFKEFHLKEVMIIEKRHSWSERANQMVAVGRLYQDTVVDVQMSEAGAVWYVSEESHGTSEAREKRGTEGAVGGETTEDQGQVVLDLRG